MEQKELNDIVMTKFFEYVKKELGKSIQYELREQYARIYLEQLNKE